jgi:hypothetical protein
MKIVLMRLSPLVKEVERLAKAEERVANALERLLLHLGVRPTPPTEEEMAGETEVTYADDLTTAEREAEEELVRLGYLPKPPEEG